MAVIADRRSSLQAFYKKIKFTIKEFSQIDVVLLRFFKEIFLRQAADITDVIATREIIISCIEKFLPDIIENIFTIIRKPVGNANAGIRHFSFQTLRDNKRFIF